MNQQTQRTATALTYCGLLPFLFLCIAIFMKFTGADYSFALRGYSLAIISFLCGIHWASHLFFPNQYRRNLLVISNVITLIAYASLLMGQQNVTFLAQSVCFLILLFVDYELLSQGIIPRWYFILRRNATTIVVFLLLGVGCFS